jgi:hypothetical protein
MLIAVIFNPRSTPRVFVLRTILGDQNSVHEGIYRLRSEPGEESRSVLFNPDNVLLIPTDRKLPCRNGTQGSDSNGVDDALTIDGDAEATPKLIE